MQAGQERLLAAGERPPAFFERTLGYRREPVPGNIPCGRSGWILAAGKTMHAFFVEGFEVWPFEHEFGRHVALCYPGAGFAALERSLGREGAELIDPLRSTPFERFFFREPVNGYVFEVIDRDRAVAEMP
jgi:hypothetical protein